MAIAFVFGFLCGFIGSIPLAGPIALLVFGRGVRGAYGSGLAIAIGAAIPEAAYACLAYWGVGELMARYTILTVASRAAAAILFIGLGLYFVLHSGRQSAPESRAERWDRSMAVGFTVTALNPTFIATWTATVAILHSTGLLPPDRWGAPFFAVGVGTGIVGWFWIMLELLRRYKERFRTVTLRRMLQVIGAILVVMGVVFVIQTVKTLIHH